MSMFADTILPRREDPALRRWGIAALVVIFLHVCAGIGFLLMRQPDIPPGNPPDAVMINLAPLAVAPPPQDEVETPPQPDEVQPDTPPPPTPIEPPPPEPQQPVTATQAPVAPEVLPAPQPEVVMAPPPPPPPPKAEEKPIEKKPPPKPVVKHEAKPRAEVKSTRSDLPHAAREAAPTPGLNGASVADWKSEIVMRISSVKRYPEAARSQGTSGTATVAFSVDRSGRVVSARLSASSGSSILDQEALATVRRANPLPAPPPGVPGGSFTIPLHFSVR